MRRSEVITFECKLCFESLDSEAAWSPGGQVTDKDNREYNNRTEICALLCGHMFHRFCALGYLDTNNLRSGECRCPTCTIQIVGGKDALLRLSPTSSAPGTRYCAKPRCRKLRLDHSELRDQHEFLKFETTRRATETTDFLNFMTNEMRASSARAAEAMERAASWTRLSQPPDVQNQIEARHNFPEPSNTQDNPKA